jgi:hypothetical protein
MLNIKTIFGMLLGIVIIVNPVLTFGANLNDAISIWLLDEGSGSTVSNEVQDAPEGVIIGYPAWVEGLYGNALDFDGLENGVEIASNPLAGAHALTIQAYINPSSIPDYESSKIFNIALQRQIDGVDRFMLDMLPMGSGWVLSHFMSIDGNRSDPEETILVTGPEHPFDEWYHVAMVFDSVDVDKVKIKHYVNHVLEHEWDYIFGTLNEGGVFIGERYQAKGSGIRNYFAGTMDYFILHDKALTPDEFMPEPSQINVSVRDLINPPAKFALHQNFPNPFNPETVIYYNIPKGFGADVKLEIFNLTGQSVIVLADGILLPGNYSVRWDGKNASGAQVPTGIYFYRLTAGDNVQIRKMVLVE